MGQLSGAWQQVMHPVSLWPGSMVWVILTVVAVVGPVKGNVEDDMKKCNVRSELLYILWVICRRSIWYTTSIP